MKTIIAKRTLTAAGIAALALAAACSNDPVSTQQTDNPAITVGVLFEVDGCKVYRFRDAGNPVYFTNCIGAEVSTFRTEHCGKGCVRRVPVRVQTSREPDHG